MKRVALLVVVALALLSLAAAADASPAVGASVRKHDGRKFGVFLKQRLAWKLKEYRRDLKAAIREVDLVKGLNRDICSTVPKNNNRRIARARAAVRFWKGVVAARKSVLGFHGKRHNRYRKMHRYMKKGPKARRAAIKRCRKEGKKRCGRRWCKKNRRACDKWRESRKYYRRAHDKRVILKHHGRVRRSHHWRLRRAVAALSRALKRLNKVKRQGKKNRKLARCRYHAKRRTARWSRRVNKIKAKIHKIKGAFPKLKAKIARRVAKYKAFHFKRCRKVPGGRNHAFTCRKGKNPKTRKTFKFRRCRRFKRFSKKHKKVIHLRRCHK